MARIFVWAILMVAVVAEAQNLSAFDDVSRRATAHDNAVAALDARLRAIEDAQPGVRAKTEDITKLLSNLQAHPPKRRQSGSGKQKPSP